MPYHRIEQQLAWTSADLPRSCKVSLMAQLERLYDPLLLALRKDPLAIGYVHVDATPIGMLDRTPPGQVREATLSAYGDKAALV